MADLQLGNRLGVTQVGLPESKIAEVVADGANTFTVAVADAAKFAINQRICFRVKSTGALFGATVRTVTIVNSLGVVNYDGADVALVPGTHAIYDPEVPIGVNTVLSDTKQGGGGTSAEGAFNHPIFYNMKSLKDWLRVQDAAYFTDARMNVMTENDLIYAARVRLTGGIK